MPDSEANEPSNADLERRVDQLEATIEKMMPTRRGVLTGLAGAGIGGAAVYGATDPARAQAAGAQGTEAEPNDMWAWNLNVANQVTSDLAMGDNDVTGVGAMDVGALNNADATTAAEGQVLIKAATGSQLEFGGVGLGWETILSDSDNDSDTAISFDTGTLSQNYDYFMLNVDARDSSGTLDVRFNGNDDASYAYNTIGTAVTEYTDQSEWSLIELDSGNNRSSWSGIIVDRGFYQTIHGAGASNNVGMGESLFGGHYEGGSDITELEVFGPNGRANCEILARKQL